MRGAVRADGEQDERQPRRIRVIVVDDHPMVRSGLKAMLSCYRDIEHAGEASTGSEAVRLCETARPDVVLMDLVMPDLDGAGATAMIRTRWPQIEILALTSFTDDDIIAAALRAGAIGCVMKTVAADDLAEAIRATARGRSVLAPEAAQALVHAVNVPIDAIELTPREREVLGLIAEGMSNGEIAERLVVSLSTVKTHVSSILTKLGASSRTEAAMRAVREGLL